MALPIRGLSTRSRRGRSSSSERSRGSSRWSRRSRSSSRGDSSERSSVLSGTSSARSERTGRSYRWRRRSSSDKNRERGRKKDALLANYGNFMSRKSTRRTERTAPTADNEANCNRSHGSRGSNRPPYDPSRPFLIPPDQTLSPRCDIWFVLAITSCASVSSFAQASSRGGPADALALSVCAISFSISSISALGMRYAPFRTAFSSYGGGRSKNLLQELMQSAGITPELLTLAFLGIMWLIGISIIVNGNVNNDALAVSGTEIWNANLFYSAWLSTLLTWYLFIEVLTLSDRNGVIPRYPEMNSRYQGWQSNRLTKRWCLLFLGAVVMLSSSLRMYGGPNCVGILKSTGYCSRSLVGVIMGGFMQLLMCAGVFVVYRLSSMRDYSHMFSLEKRNKLTFGIGSISLLIQSINVGVLTSPTGGGPGTSSGTVYFASWVGFVLAFEMVLRYVEFFSTYGADGKRIASPAPLMESESSSRGSRGVGDSRPQDTVLMLTTGSRRGARSTGTASTSDSEHDKPVILQIQAALPPALAPPPALLPSQQPKARGPPASVSEASPSQLLMGTYVRQKEPHDAFSIGSAPKLEPDGSSGSSSKYEVKNRETYSRGSSSKGSGKTPEGYYLDNHAFGQQTSFHVDRMEELDQSKPSIHTGPHIPPPRMARSKSPLESSHRLTSLSEVSNEKSSPSTHSTMSPRYTEPERPQARASSRQSSRPSSRDKKSGSASRASRQSSAPRSRPHSRHSSQGNSQEHDTHSSGSQDPPPTISEDDLGTHTTASASEYLQRTRQVSQHSSRQHSRRGSKKSGRSDSRSKASRGPPPPPFHRGVEMTPNGSVGSAIPVKSVNAYGNTAFDVSEPTIDVPENPLPTAQEMARLTMTMPMEYDFKESATTNSYDYGKKWSDSTGGDKTMHRSSSDENPSSQEAHADKDQVDDIVAAALAYAEKSHADDGVRSSSSLGGHLRPISSMVHNESIHSFYSRSQASPNQGVDEMVARALNQAGEQAAQSQRAQPRRMDSSMYSEYSEQSGMDSQFGGQFNC